jgi:hypothetical protein
MVFTMLCAIMALPLQMRGAEVKVFQEDAAPVRPQVLVIISDHGSGTAEFGAALQTHPCMIDLGEPFAFKKTVWATNEVSGCTGSMATDMSTTIFNAVTGELMRSSNPVLMDRIAAQKTHVAIYGKSSETQVRRPVALNIVGDEASLYDGLNYNFAEYVVRIRDHVCAGVPATVCAAADCTITLKMLPQFVNGNTAGVLMKDDPPASKCTTARNEKAMIAWKDALQSMVDSPKVATFALTRNERDRQFSLFEEFGLVDGKFDCSIERKPSPFASVATYPSVDDEIHIEDCWTGTAGANKCLETALKLVGLSAADAFGTSTAGAEKMANSNTAKCAASSKAVFKRLGDGNVEKFGDVASPVSLPAPEEAAPEEAAPVSLEAAPVSEEAPAEATPVSEEAVPGEAAPAPEEAAPAEATPVSEEAVPEEAAPAPEEAAPAEATPVSEEAVPEEAAPAPEETAPAEATPVSEEAVPGEAAPAPEEAAPAEATPVSEEAVPEEAAPAPEEAAPAEATPVSEEAVPGEAAPAPEEAAPAEATPVSEEAVPGEAVATPEEAAPAEATPVSEEAVPEEAAPVSEEAVPVSGEAASAEATPVSEEAVPEEAAPVSEEAAPAEATPVSEEAVPEEAAPVSEQAVPMSEEAAPAEATPVSEEAAPVSEAPVSEDEDTPYLLSEEHGLEAAPVPKSSKRPHRSRESPPW